MLFLRISIYFLLFILFPLEVKSEIGNSEFLAPQFFIEEPVPDLSYEIQDVREQIMLPCRDQYIQNEGLSLEGRIDDMMDCLILRSNKKLNASATHSNLSFSEKIKTERELPVRFGLHPPTKAELLESLLATSQLSLSIYANDDGYSGRIEFDTVVPLQKNPSTDTALFLQPGFILSLKNTKAETNTHNDDNFFIASAGVVYRFAVRDGILGFNLFYDHQRALKNTTKHNRLSTGVDYQSGRNKLSVNYYHPLGDWVDIGDFYGERVAQTADLFWEFLINEQWESSIGFSVSNYKSKKIR